MYAGLIKLAAQPEPGRHYSKNPMVLAGSCGLLTTVLAMAVAFVPSHQIESSWLFEIKMVVGTLFFLGLAAFFFFVYGRRKVASPVTTSA